MKGIDFYIYIVISLFGVAYPLLLQVIARLDEKYSSDNIVELFDQEPEGKAFRYLLYSSIGCIIIWTLKLEPLVKCNGLEFIIDHSASILVSLSTIGLIVAFFFLVRKILIYYSPTNFIKYLISKHTLLIENAKYFEALGDLLYLSIRIQQRNETLTLSDFFYTAFKNEREKQSNQPVVYPDMYYEIVHKSIEELAILRDKRNYSLEYRTAGGIWLLGELQEREISERTYYSIWQNLLLMVKYNQDDMIMYHWETANQYFVYSLKFIQEDRDRLGDGIVVRNKEVVEKRRLERRRFIEFHYALGGLLLYSQMYSSINRIFSYTTSQPPKYELLPLSMNEIFSFFISIRDPYDRKYAWISSLYPFPKQNGIKADWIVKRWIASYMAVLFLRQYTIVSYMVYIKPLEYPSILKTQPEIREWIDSMDYFKQLVESHLENGQLLKELNLTFLTREWCNTHNKVYPLDFIDNLKNQLKEAYDRNAENLFPSPNKEEKYKNTTKQIIEETLEKFNQLKNLDITEDKSDKWYVGGEKMLQDKDAFSEHPEVDHTNFDSIQAITMSENIIEGIASTFLRKKSKSYLLKEDDFFHAIDKLDLDEKFVIVSWGVDIDYYLRNSKITHLSQKKYRDVDLIDLGYSRILDPSFFILRKVDLPNIETQILSQAVIDKYSLEEISELFKVYVSVIDLNKTSTDITEEVQSERGNIEDLRKFVLLSILFKLEIKWKKQIDMIQIVRHDEYRQRGLLNNVKDIKTFATNTSEENS